jgi:hypothetical protein
LDDPIYPPKVDWAQIMVDLYNHGCTKNRAAKIVGASVCAATNWTKGGQPGHAYGEALLILHGRFCGEALTKLRLSTMDRKDTEEKAA